MQRSVAKSFSGVTRSLGLILGMGLCALALAGPSLELRQCAALEDAVARLGCYDALAAEAGIQARDVASEAPPALADADLVEPPSAVELRMKQSRLVRDNWFSMTPYRPNYFLPVTYNSRPNQELFQSSRGEDAQIDRFEAKFQFSLAVDVWREMLGQEMASISAIPRRPGG